MTLVWLSPGDQRATELLVLAERSGLRIHEVPVDWIDDPDSRVDIMQTALAELGAQLGRAPHPAAVPGVPPTLLRQAVRFAANLLVTLVRFVLLRAWVFHPRLTAAR